MIDAIVFGTNIINPAIAVLISYVAITSTYKVIQIINIIYECNLTKDNFEKLKKELQNNSLNLEILNEILVEID